MRIFGLGFFALAALLVAGCAKPDSTPVATKTDPTDGATNPESVSEQLKPGDPGQPKDPFVLPEMPKDAGKAVVHAPHTFKIAPPKSDGWQPVADSAGVGKKIDDAMLGVKEAWVVVNMNYDNAGNKLTGRADFKIRDKQHYRLEYYRPETEASLHRLIADGEKRVELSEGKSKKLPAFRPANKVSFSANELDQWAENFTSEMLDGYREDAQIWSGLLDAWRRGVGGYSTTVEEKEASPQGKARRYVRIVAKTKEDRPTDIEVMVDGTRYLPVAIRVVRKNADGTERKATWSAEWKFGGKHDAKEFVVPKGL